MIPDILWYLGPLLPVITRLTLCLVFRKQAIRALTQEERDTETHRTVILALAGFSFTALIALVVLEGTLQPGLLIAIYCLLISFLLFTFALNIQGYKFLYWHDQLATSFIDAGTLALMLSVLSILNSKVFPPAFAITLSFITFSVWSIDHFIRLRLEWIILSQEKKQKGNSK